MSGSSRYSITEGSWVVGKFHTGDSVSVAIYDLSTGNAVVVDDDSAAEIGATGYFRWSTAEITVQPIVFTEYLLIMSNGTAAYDRYTKIVLGGYPDTVDRVWERR